MAALSGQPATPSYSPIPVQPFNPAVIVPKVKSVAPKGGTSGVTINGTSFGKFSPIPNTGVSGGSPAGYHPAVAANQAATTVSKTQQMLVKLGYHVGVDGILGPQTASALKAQKAGMSAAAWNASQQGQPAPSQTPAQTTVAGVSTQGAPTTKPNSTGTTPPGNNIQGTDNVTLQQLITAINNTAPGSDAGAIAAIAKGLTNNQINPGQVATAAANAQYNPAISGLKNQVGQSMAQGSTDQKDISGWYNTLVANMNSRAAQESTAGSNEVSQISAVAPGTSAALGFSPGTAGANNIDAGGAIQANAAKMGAQSENDFNQQLIGTTKAQGLASQVNQLNIDRNKTVGLQQQLVAQQQARGQDVTALTAQNRQQNATNQNNYVNQKLGVQSAEQSANQQAFSNKEAGASALIAAQAAQSTANLQNAEAGKYGDEGAAAVTNAGTNRIKATNAAKIGLINANAAALRASNGTLTAQAAKLRATATYTTAMSKMNSVASEVFSGTTGTNVGKIGQAITTGIHSTPGIFDQKTGALLVSKTRLAADVRQQMTQNGADLTSANAKAYAMNAMQILGVNPTQAQATQWFNFTNSNAPVSKKIQTARDAISKVHLSSSS